MSSPVENLLTSLTSKFFENLIFFQVILADPTGLLWQYAFTYIT